jgi:hypothetical protein
VELRGELIGLLRTVARASLNGCVRPAPGTSRARTW